MKRYPDFRTQQGIGGRRFYHNELGPRSWGDWLFWQRMNRISKDVEASAKEPSK